MADKNEIRAAKAEEKAAKARAKAKRREEKKNKPGFLSGLKSEMKKITWYSKKATLLNSIWVAVALVIFAALIGVIDLGLLEGLQALSGIFA